MSREWHQSGFGDGWLHVPGASGGVLSAHRCRQRRPQSFHRRLLPPGVRRHLQDVLDTLVYLRRDTDVWFEITTLLIPGRNDSDAEITAECEWIRENLGVDVPVHFTAFHPDYKMTDTRRPHPPP
ncbi:putative pYRUVATE FORMATE LYASE ACTIVATING PROTEIN PFLA [Mycobacterium xenopi 4042]|uniref:Putative pYRUVATE FORMATE LYASE ACTIVATING PROTEIN PFLA n=1 Tax=Mycobacterium xenopi 4042 TaxID=1299334 RepID=X7Z4X6_MYCXE|nr:putative pYRUVATE FORMATE LYASE ACTIVATING PROTEIN PFLA [Mycobacterium xenopi 4042]